VLLGAPGSGKSSVGAALGEAGLRWRDWELEIVRRWGSREQFVAEKPVALPALHAAILEWVAADDTTSAVVETTGLSDAPFIRELIAGGGVVVVRLDVGEDEALRRVGDRAQGRHLTDELEANRRVWRAFYGQAAENFGADLVIDTEQTPVPAAVEHILSLRGRRDPS
jgi:shikimate kinase